MLPAREFVRMAKTHIGLPYKWGGDFDGTKAMVL